MVVANPASIDRNDFRLGGGVLDRPALPGDLHRGAASSEPMSETSHQRQNR